MRKALLIFAALLAASVLIAQSTESFKGFSILPKDSVITLSQYKTAEAKRLGVETWMVSTPIANSVLKMDGYTLLLIGDNFKIKLVQGQYRDYLRSLGESTEMYSGKTLKKKVSHVSQ